MLPGVSKQMFDLRLCPVSFLSPSRLVVTLWGWREEKPLGGARGGVS